MVYNSRDENNNFLFPEQEYGIVSDNNFGLALSGGGSRAFTMSMAVVRFLEKKNLINSISYVSTISGSNWFICPYTFRELDLGRYRSPENITMKILENDNIGFAGDVCIDTPIKEYLLEAKQKKIKKDKIWQYIVGKCYLKRYNLDEKMIAINKKRSKSLLRKNSIECEIPIDKRPFWISGSSISGDRGPVFLQSTPMYSGLQTRVYVDNEIVGGEMIETHAFDSFNPIIDKINSKQTVDLIINDDFTLDDIIGISSAAFTDYLPKIDNTIDKYIHSKKSFFENINPKYNIWDIKKENNLSVKISDGYKVDNLGIIPLVARGCKKILCMCSNLEIEDSLMNTGLLPLFGIWGENGGTDNISDSSQIFSKDDWESISAQIEKRKLNGGPVYVNKKLDVLPNKRLSITGNYKVELFIYFLYPSSEYIDSLPEDVKNEMIVVKKNPLFSSSNKLEGFPNFKTVFQNKGKIVGYTREQVNILHYYVQWCLKKTEKKLFKFFNKDFTYEALIEYQKFEGLRENKN